jgi:UDP-N-acetylglucosamine 2-epimerase (non-hydrolysing)
MLHAGAGHESGAILFVSKHSDTDSRRGTSRTKTILAVLGTRPEAIKMAPVIRRMHKNRKLRPVICVTAQHREMLDQMMDLFHLEPDFDLNIMTGSQSLAEITTRVLEGMTGVLRETRPDCVLVQGDTTTAFVTSLAAFYENVPVAHIEAGLRTRDKRNPFPEEINRRLISRIADIHFAPTQESRANLLAEGVRRSSILVTGNTVVDALHWMLRATNGSGTQLEDLKDFDWSSTISVLVTAHRRENWDKMHSICQAIREIVHHDARVHVIFPVHPNPNVCSQVKQELGSTSRVHLLPPLPYPTFLAILSKCRLVVTDSGGVQEEAASLGKPVVIMRNTTERPEVVHCGCGILAGTSPTAIVQAVQRALLKPQTDLKRNPFGDGRAAERIVHYLEHCLTEHSANGQQLAKASQSSAFSGKLAQAEVFSPAANSNSKTSGKPLSKGARAGF